MKHLIQYKEGWRGYLAKEPGERPTKDMCPYEKGTEEHRYWWAGYFACRDDPARISELSGNLY